MIPPINCPKPWKMIPGILLQPNIPKPMHGTAPRVVLGQAWWDLERRAAYLSTSYHCIACGVFRRSPDGRRKLEGHEVYNIDYLLGRMEYVETVPLCTQCHAFIHCGRLEIMRRKGEVTDEEYQATMTHGTSILKRASLTRPAPYEGFIADWKDWRLVVNGVEYPPKFRSYEEWFKHFEWV